MLGPHATSRDDLIQVDTGMICPDGSLACVQSPLEAIRSLNGPTGSVVHQQGCSLIDNSTAGYAAALAAAMDAEVHFSPNLDAH